MWRNWEPRWTLLIVCVTALALPPSGQSFASAQSTAERILFAVWPAQAGKKPNAPVIDPIGVLVGSRIRSLGDYNKLPDAFFTRFEKSYYTPGRTFPLLSGGSEQGQVSVQKAVGISCVSLIATVKLPIPMPDPQMALVVTSVDGLELHRDWREPPTPEQRAAFLQLSYGILRRRALPASSISDIKIDSLYSTKLGAKEPPSLIGSVTLEQKTAISHLFLMATRDGASYKATLVSYHTGTDVEDHTDDVAETFVDQLGLDYDGIDEVVTIVGYSESWDYIVYNEVGGVWKKIYEGGGGGC